MLVPVSYTHLVYVDGEPTAMVFTQSAHNSVNAKGVYCVETTNGDGIVTSVTYIGTNTNGVQQAYTNDGVNNDFYTVKAVGSRSFSLNNANQEQLTVNNETVYVLATYDLKDNKSTYKAPSVGEDVYKRQPQGRTKPFTEMCWGASRRKPRKWGSTLWGLPSLTSGFMSHNGVLHILRRVLMLLEVCKVRFYNLHRTFVTLTLQSGVDMKTASGILGRYSAGFTLDTYPYVTTAAQKTTEKIINILKS